MTVFLFENPGFFAGSFEAGSKQSGHRKLSGAEILQGRTNTQSGPVEQSAATFLVRRHACSFLNESLKFDKKRHSFGMSL
jgi:hypothetical protein